MGIGYQAAQMLCKYYQDNRNLPNNAKCIMLGRHNMTFRTKKQKNIVLSSFPHIEMDGLTGFAEVFFKNLGFTDVDSLDLTDFEGANKLYNLSIPLSTQNANSIENKYDAVFDLGTSEHIFSTSSSINNSLYMLKKGGELVMSLPMSGSTDHGFFQVSPCFYYALNNDILELERLYFYHSPAKTAKILAYDGMDKDFKKHVDGIYDGSFFANVLSHSGKPFSSFAVFRKKSNDTLDNSDVIQPIYRAMSSGNTPKDYIPGYKPEFKIRVYKFLYKITPELLFAKLVLLTYKTSRVIFSK